MANWILRLIGVLLMLTALAVALSRAPDRPVQTLVARWAPLPSEFVELQGQLVHLRDEGPRADALPIVLVHGTSSSLHTWEGWVRELRTQRRVITFDLPGFGLTGPSASGDYHGDTYARFVLALMDRLQVGRFVIGGNSLGGEVAWRVASLAPARVDRLLLVDAAGYPLAPESVPLGFRAARMPVVGWLSQHLLPRGVIEASLRDVYGDPSRVNGALVERYFEITLREGNRRALGERLQAMEQDLAAPDQVVARLRGLKLPTLILWGALDRLIPPESARRFEADIAGSQLVLLEGLGHVPQEEDPQRSLAAAAGFLGLRR